MGLFDAHCLDTNLYFLHRGVIQPKSGIGAHFHNQCEEMFVIFDGEAQFTIDGRTSLLKGPAGAPCRMGHSHAIYNPTDKPVQWMNINVCAMKGTYDAFDLGDPRVDVQLDRIPVFMTMRLDRTLLRPVPPPPWGKGDVQYRRVLDTTCLQRTLGIRGSSASWSRPSTVPHLHRELAEFYYVIKGRGNATVSERDQSETAAIRKAMRFRFNSTRCIPLRTPGRSRWSS